MIKFCSLFSGSSGNSIFLGTKNTKLLIDAGLSGKKITEALSSIGENPSELSAILVSHEHSDHIKGVGVISRRFNVPIFANPSTWEAMGSNIGKIDNSNCMHFYTGQDFEVGDICIRTFPTPHDASEPVGFNFFIGNKKLTVATDIGHINKTLLNCFVNSHLILIESNHDEHMLKVGSYPWVLKKRILSDTGHLSNEMAGKVVAYLAEKGSSRFILGHLSKENNFPELAYETVCTSLKLKGIEPGRDVTLDVVLRDRVGKVLLI